MHKLFYEDHFADGHVIDSPFTPARFAAVHAPLFGDRVKEVARGVYAAVEPINGRTDFTVRAATRAEIAAEAGQ